MSFICLYGCISSETSFKLSPIQGFRKNLNWVKITKRAHAFKGYTSSYIVEILNFFNPELQLKDTESEIKNKLKIILSELR